MRPIGKLDKKITLQAPTVARGDTGGMSQTWTTQDTVWAFIEDVSSKESMQSSMRKGEKQTRFVIRYSTDTDDIRSNWRISYAGNVYDIDPPVLIPTGRPNNIEILGVIRSAEGAAL